MSQEGQTFKVVVVVVVMCVCECVCVGFTFRMLIQACAKIKEETDNPHPLSVFVCV